MALHPKVKELLDLAREVAPMLGMAHDPQCTGGDQLKARIGAVKRLENLTAIAAEAAESSSTVAEPAIELRKALADALHQTNQLHRLDPAITALEVAGYQANNGQQENQKSGRPKAKTTLLVEKLISEGLGNDVICERTGKSVGNVRRIRSAMNRKS